LEFFVTDSEKNVNAATAEPAKAGAAAETTRAVNAAEASKESAATAATPAKKEKSSIVGVLLQMAIGGVVGFLIMYVAGSMSRSAGELSKLYMLSMLLLLPLAFLLVIVVHECGHLVAALSQGFRFHVLTLGPMAIIRMPVGVQIQWNWRILMLIGGQQISSPPRDVLESGDHRGYLVYLAGGGAANLVTAAVAAAALVWLPLPLIVRMLLVTFFAFSVLLGILNLLPLKFPGGIKADGFHIRALLRNDSGATYFRALFEYIYNTYEGVHPKDWSPRLLDGMFGSAESAIERMYANALAFMVAGARDDLARAREVVAALEADYDVMPHQLRGGFSAALAQVFSTIFFDREKALRYAKDALKPSYLASPATPVRAAACLAYAEGRYDEAISLAEKAIALGPRGTSALDRMLEPQAAAELLARARERRGGAALS
jgi:uncharacterized membrane protein (Fun14 family)